MIGIDIVKISRIEKMIQKFGNKALEKFLCDEEIALVSSSNTAAGFWATKEALSKALQTGIGKECGFKDIKIYKDSKNAPNIALKQNIIKKFHIQEASVSITHDGDYAIAVVALQTDKTTHVKGF
jgi:holo-[acyl-carrier protein] synthase